MSPGQQGDNRGLLRSVKFRSLLEKLPGLLLQSPRERGFLVQPLLGGVFPDVLGDFHRAEMRAAHAAEVGDLGAFLRQGLIVELAGRFRDRG